MAEPLDEISFQAALEAKPINLPPLFEGIQILVDAEKQKQVDTFTTRLMDALVENNDTDGALDLIDYLVEINMKNRAFKRVCEDKLRKLFAEDETRLAMVDASDFGSARLRASKCMSRFRLLHTLVKGSQVYEKTWGYGVVSLISSGERKVFVDFTDKPNHGMAFSYAAEALTIIDDKHLFSLHHKNPEAVEEMVKKDPSEVIRMILRSFGPKPIAIIQELLVPRIVKDSGWKKFWDGARKVLKEDTLVVIPSKRSEPIELLEEAKSFDNKWFDSLTEEKDMEMVLERLREFFEKSEDKELDDDARAAVEDRLAFVVKGGQPRKLALVIKSILMARDLGIQVENINADAFMDKLYEPEHFAHVTREMAAKDRKPLLQLMEDLKIDETIELAKSPKVLLNTEYGTLNDLVDFLTRHGQEQDVADTLRREWNTWNNNVFSLYWLSKNADKIEAWEFGTKSDLAMRILANVEQEFMGEENRVQNQLRELFRNPEWLKDVFESISPRQRRTITTGVKNSTGWPKLDKASVMGQIVKLYPEMEEIVSGRSDAENAGGGGRRGMITSFNSFHQRLQLLEKLKREDIPNNSKEIAKAREYGDLRENFEYKAAKDTQRLMLQREAELEKQLSIVKPTDFKDFPNEVAGMGTGVEVKFDTGKTETYYLLGEWDSDETLNIVSIGSGLARAFAGHPAGTEVSIPSEDGEIQCTMTKVMPLPESVVKWIGTAELLQAVT